jgi:hypothetical protein
MLVARNQEIGVMIVAPGTSAMLSDVVVRETRPRADGLFGRAFDLQGAASLVAERVIATDNFGGTMSVDGEGTSVTLVDAALLGSAGSGSPAGRGIGAQFGASVTANHLLIDRASDVAVAVDFASQMTLTDAIVRDTHPALATRSYGYGVAVQHDSELTGERVVIEGSREIGLVSVRGATVTLSDIAVRDTRRSECECDTRVFGFGAAAIGPASMTLERVEIDEAATCGLIVSSSATGESGAMLDVMTGRVSRSAIGACVQVAGYDLSRLMRDVIFEDNGTSLETTDLPVPDVTEPLEP